MVNCTGKMTMHDSDWHREAVGAMWKEIGKLQFDFLKRMGLEPHHYLLDVGCGSLRGGVHLIGYLEPGHYFGVDKDKELLEAGRNVELKRYGLLDRNATLIQMDDFDFELLNTKFNYALAQSVFTHLTLNEIIRCIINIQKVLVQDGRFYSTFFENPRGKFNLQPIRHDFADGSTVVTYFDKDPFHHDFGTFRQICEGTSLKVEYVGDWNHPRDQKMLVFIKQ